MHPMSETEMNYDPSIPLKGMLMVNIKAPTGPCLLEVLLIYNSTKLITNPLIYIHV